MGKWKALGQWEFNFPTAFLLILYDSKCISLGDKTFQFLLDSLRENDS